MAQSQEYLKREFFHYVSDTLALLGADESLVKKIQEIEEKPITPQIIDEIRQFNCSQIDMVKNRLALCHTMTFQKGD